MNYNDDWREDRHRNRKEDSNFHPRMEDNRNQRQRSQDSGYYNNSEYASRNSGSIDRSDYRNQDRPWSDVDQNGRNPNWDRNAPDSSRYENRYENEGSYGSQVERNGGRNGNYGNPNDYGDNPNRNYSAQGMRDPRYGNPGFSDRQRQGSNGGSSDNYERGNYGNYADYRSSGTRFSEGTQGRYGSHTEGWNNNEDSNLDRSLGRRDNYDSGQNSHRGKGPKNYKRSDSRIQEDINDALTDHHNVDASDIEVEVKDGVAILSGTVDNRDAKRRAENAIDYISGVHNVENRIHVKSDSRSSSSSSNGNSHMRSQSDSDRRESEYTSTSNSASNSKTKNSKASAS